MVFPEGFMTGRLTTIMVPMTLNWVVTFDDLRDLSSK